jgi:hypothetical protein
MADSRRHLSELELSLIQDGAPAAGTEAHLEACAECKRRLAELQWGVSVFAEYDAQCAESAPRAWRSLAELVADQPTGRRWNLQWMTWAAVAATVVAAAGITLWWQSRESGVTEAELVMRLSVESGYDRSGRLKISARGQTLFRPAVLVSDTGKDPELVRVRGLFVSANYDWREPMSARSFLDWRKNLRRRKDQVTLLETGGHRAYRVTTENQDGRLRAVSLTLNAGDWRPTRGSFDFSDQGTVELEDAPQAPAAEPRPSPSAPAETPLSPSDTLRVLAALHQIGADVDDPLAVTEDPAVRAIIVSGGGIASGRQQEIVRALTQVPRALVRFQTDPDPVAHTAPAARERYSSHTPPALRQRWETAFGGPLQLQEATDRLLDASSSLLARANALRLLAEKFPAAAEQRLTPDEQRLLRSLRRDHAQRMSELLRSMDGDLAHLLPAPRGGMAAAPTAAWQPGVAALVHGARESDALLNRLLAGSYPESAAEELMRALNAQLESVRAEVARQQVRGE